MYELDFELKAKQAREKFERLANRLGDLKPVWKDFIPLYKRIIKESFENKGRIMESKSWIGYSGGNKSPYLKRKLKKWGTNKLLFASGALYKAMTSGLVTKVKKDNLTFIVAGKDYFFHVQERKKWGRHYLNTPKKDIPMIAWRALRSITKYHLDKAMGGGEIIGEL